MNSEELELSLRTEFENYLKGVVAQMRQDVADFQKNFEAELDKHRSQVDDAFRNLATRFESDIKFDPAFTESVVEHLRLARDDGAQLTAHAFSEAQKLDQPTAPAANYNQLRDAINEITTQTTQSAILKALVDQAARFTARGAFFIVKQDSFICWRKFDHDNYGDDERVREIHFPVSADTMLADSVRSLATSNVSGSEDSVYLDALGFGRPDRMFAIPLIARGRAVAVLYADSSSDDVVNLEAIESLVRVAGLTVELRAASVPVAQPAPPAEAPAVSDSVQSEDEGKFEEQAEESHEVASEEPVEEAPAYEVYTGEVAVEQGEEETAEYEAASVEEYAQFEPVAVEEQEAVEEVSSTPEYETNYGDYSEAAPAEPVSDFAFASSDSYDATAEEEEETVQPAAPVEEYAYSGEAANGVNGRSYEATPEPVIEVASSQPMKSRLSDRHVDLPIEVSDEERRFHNDARRFARLLVSEIKLYNEQKVNEGRDAADLYDRLREAIDRSREMYDKRVHPAVAAKFDYFHYELVNNLAEGNGSKLGGSYPGATV